MSCGKNCECNKKNDCKLTNFKKWLYTLYTALILLVLFNPYSYLLVNRIIGGVCNKAGCPTTMGFLLHTIVFIIILRLLM